MIGKAFWLSKTFWVNVLAGVAIVAQALWGWVMDPEVETSILAGINLVLRLVTKEPITWSTPTIPPAAMILVAVLGMAVMALRGPSLPPMRGPAAWLVAVSALWGLLNAFAMSMDFPASERRFSRLTG